MKKLLVTLAAFLVAVSMTACAASGDTSGGVTGGAINGAKPEASAYTSPGGADEKSVITTAAGYISEGDFGFDMEAVAEMADGSFDMAGMPPEDVYGYENGIPRAAGTLTAGEWIDNDHYSFWRDLFQYQDTGWENYRSAWNRGFCSRVFVTVARNGKPVENSAVTLYNADGEAIWNAKTDNEGKAYLFYIASELTKGDLTVKTDFNGEMTITGEKQAIAFTMEGEEVKTASSLDLALVVDTTGSMSDELSYLQKELEDVISRAAKDNGNIPIRLSVDFYRDDGDEYVVRDFDFTDSVAAAIADLNAQEADGGGDYPEKVNAALDTAINGLSWNETSTKLLFIILDAPPHPEAAEDMNRLTVQAAEKGIRIIPILASGGDKETEFLMRDVALKTGGTYLFLTDDSGVSAGGHITPTTGPYTVEKLNDLMVKVINRYLDKSAAVAEYTDINVALPEQTSTETDPPTVIPMDGEVTMELSGLQNGTESVLGFVIFNNTDREYRYGNRFEIEKVTGSGWEKVKPTIDYAVTEILMLVQPWSTAVFEAPVPAYWDLEPGNYRLVLEVFSDVDSREIYGHFSIPDKSAEGEITMTLAGREGNTLNFLIHNGTDSEYSLARYISLEKLSDGKWTYVEPDDMLMFTDDMIILPSGESYLFSAPVYGSWKNLEAGKYRVVIDSIFKGDDPAEKLYGEFEVTDNAENGEISMLLKDDPKKLMEDEPLTYIIRNRTDREYYYGLGFTLEKIVDDEWEAVPPREDFAVIEIAVIVAPGENGEFEAEVYKYWKPLEDGVYRVVVNVSSEADNRELYGQFRVNGGRIESGNFEGSPAAYSE